jgi:3-deoxy-D-manno-octulosonate 8-phosphate phosphatase (KDO 8-P phosphatase)
MVASRRGRKAKKLSLKTLKERAARIRLVLTDSDGVLTDSGVYYSADGESFKRFSIRDGMGVELLRNAGIASAIITSETSQSVRRRAEKLEMPYLYMGIADKQLHLDTIMSQTNLKLDQLAYIGDDVNDLGIIEAIGNAGLTGAPADATHAIKKSVHYCSARKGGNGAFRDFGDWILRLRSS